jgi:lipid-binding SYLF domain-containing protein
MDTRIVSRFPALFSIFSLFLLLAPLGAAHAKTANEIDAGVDAAIADFRKSVKGAEEYLSSAKGVLVVPEVKKVGFIVGGQWGEGALRIDGKTADYYKMEAGSVGFQAGYQKASFVFIFLTQEALDKFRASEGWTAGADTGVTVADASLGLSVDTLKGQSSVVAFIFGKEGLMGGYSFKGEKFTKFSPEK